MPNYREVMEIAGQLLYCFAVGMTGLLLAKLWWFLDWYMGLDPVERSKPRRLRLLRLRDKLSPGPTQFHIPTELEERERAEAADE